MDGSSSNGKRNHTTGRTNGSLNSTNSRTNIHPTLQGYVRSSMIARVPTNSLEQTPSVREPRIVSAENSLERRLKPTHTARSSLEIKQRRGSYNAPRVPIIPARAVNAVEATLSDASDRDTLFPLRENLSTLGPKPSILKSPGSKTSLGKKTVSVNTGQSTIVHVRDPVRSQYEPYLPTAPSPLNQYSDIDSDSSRSQSSMPKVYSTVIPLSDSHGVAWEGSDVTDNESILSRGTNNGSESSYDNQYDDTASSYLSYETVASNSRSNISTELMVSSIFLPPQRSDTEPMKRTANTLNVASDDNQSRTGHLGELSSSTYKSMDGVFTIAISDTDNSSVLSTSDVGNFIPGEERMQGGLSSNSSTIKGNLIGDVRARTFRGAPPPLQTPSPPSFRPRDPGVPSLQRPPGGRDSRERLQHAGHSSGASSSARDMRVQPQSGHSDHSGHPGHSGQPVHSGQSRHHGHSGHSGHREHSGHAGQRRVVTFPSRVASSSRVVPTSSATQGGQTKGRGILSSSRNNYATASVVLSDSSHLAPVLHGEALRHQQRSAPTRTLTAPRGASPRGEPPRGPSPRYRMLPIMIEQDSPSEYSFSEYSEPSDADSVWSSSSVTSGYSEYQTPSSTLSPSYYSSESQYSTTPSASYYSSDGQNPSRMSGAATSEVTDLNGQVSRVRIG